MEFGFKNCETEKVVASLDTAFETSLKETFSRNVQKILKVRIVRMLLLIRQQKQIEE